MAIPQIHLTRTRRRTVAFESLWQLAADWLKHNNPCQVRNSEKGAICVACTKHPNHDPMHEPGWTVRAGTLCCGGCRHHDRKLGCTATKPLMCKIWLCRSAKANTFDKGAFLRMLDQIASDNGMHGYRESQEQILLNSECYHFTPVDHYLFQYLRQNTQAKHTNSK